MSPAKRPRPRTSGGSSSRSTDCPIHLLLPAVIDDSLSMSSPRKRGPIFQSRWLWVPAFAGTTAVAHLVAGGVHRLDDVGIAGAAAEIGGEHVEQVLVADVGLALEHAGRQHQKAGRAEAALQAVIVDEGLLQRMQHVALCQALDGADRPALGLHRKHQTRAHGLAIEQDGAGAADAVLAADVGAGLAAVVADGVDQRAARIDADVMAPAVDGERKLALFGHAAACSSARRVTVPARSRRYSADVTASSSGSTAAEAAVAAATNASRMGPRPTSACSASAMRRGCASMPPSATRGSLMTPLATR